MERERVWMGKKPGVTVVGVQGKRGRERLPLLQCLLCSGESGLRPLGLRAWGGDKGEGEVSRKGKRDDLRMNQRPFQLPFELSHHVPAKREDGHCCRNGAEYKSCLGRIGSILFPPPLHPREPSSWQWKTWKGFRRAATLRGAFQNYHQGFSVADGMTHQSRPDQHTMVPIQAEGLRCELNRKHLENDHPWWPLGHRVGKKWLPP